MVGLSSNSWFFCLISVFKIFNFSSKFGVVCRGSCKLNMALMDPWSEADTQFNGGVYWYDGLESQVWTSLKKTTLLQLWSMLRLPLTSEIKAESDGEKRIEHQDSLCL